MAIDTHMIGVPRVDKDIDLCAAIWRYMDTPKYLDLL